MYRGDLTFGADHSVRTGGVTLDFLLPKVMSPTPWLFFKEGFEDELQVANR